MEPERRIKLIPRCIEFLEGYRDYCRELYDNNIVWFRPMDPDLVDAGWFMRTKPIYDKRETDPAPGASRSFHRWVVDGDRFIGEFQLRTEFTEKVLTDIGSIGYAVRVSEWGKGYGTEILKQGLLMARDLGMEKVLFTVNEDNKRSIHVIEKMGAVLEDSIEAYNEAEGVHTLRRYWIKL
ncbi:MAG: GNAT family N-acetyltransferase [Clostridiales bacterium]|nr:GNAT family N-acetyltransferase [Clostridiales bacterium]